MRWFSKKHDSWQPSPGQIAVAIDGQDVKRRLGTRPFTIYDGTVALLFSKGRLLGRLVAGQHDIDGRIRTWLAGEAPSRLLLADAGLITVDLDVPNLRSSENIPCRAFVQLVLELDSPERFFSNAIKGRDTWDRIDLEGELSPLTFDIMRDLCATCPIADLGASAATAKLAHAAIVERLSDLLSRLGFKLHAVPIARVRSEAHERNRDQHGQASLEMERLDVLRHTREARSADLQHEAATRGGALEAMRQAAMDLKIRDRLRDDEFSRLDALLQQDAADFEHQRAADRKQQGLDHFLQHRIETAQANRQVRDIERVDEAADLAVARELRSDALKARMTKKQQDVDIERDRAHLLSETDTATKIALGTGDAEALVELERMAMQNSVPVEKLLVLAAERSDAAAAALAEKFAAQGRVDDSTIEQLQAQLDHERLSDREHADRLERVLKRVVHHMNEVAATRCGDAPKAPAPPSQRG